MTLPQSVTEIGRSAFYETAALAEMNRRNQAKAGLDKRRGRPAPPAAMTEEEQIIEQISRAKDKGIF